VNRQLAAGEFGPALQTAELSRDVHERSVLFQRIAKAQMEAGEFDASRQTIRRIPIPEKRMLARGEQAARQSQAGGSQADPDALIDLIIYATSGPWEDEEGEDLTPFFFDSGVRVDPNGMLFRLTRAELNNRLESLGIKARVASLNEEMANPSSLRLVSLTRLEQEVAKRLSAGEPVLETMKHLAGLSHISHVFVYPETEEIVIGGPAEGWRFNENGFAVGMESGHPTLQLDDLVTVLRTFSPEGNGVFRCSIDPRKEGMKQLKEFVEQSIQSGPLAKGGARRWAKQLEQKLGIQDVTVQGVPDDSRVARVIVEADYRMKMIGVGKLAGVAGIESFFDLLTPAQQKSHSSIDALRWWMTMKYDAVLHDSSRSVFEVQGSSVKCQSENEMISDQGVRIHTGKSEATNRQFASKFTEHYAALANKDVVFADLQNVFDLALVAALVRHERLDERTGWDLGVFASDGTYQPKKYDPASTMMSVINHRVYGGKNVVAQVAGGVRGDLMSVVKDGDVYKESEQLEGMAEVGRAPKLPEGRWWWDVAE